MSGRDPDERTAATWWAIMLARDIDTCRALLRGEHVEPARLNAKWLARAKALELVRLDCRAIDLFFTSFADQDLGGEESVA